MALQQRPLMPDEILSAALNGDSDFLVRHLVLHEDRREVMITIGNSQSAAGQTEVEHTTVPSELINSATHFGDTLLHLLITRRHNQLALKVFLKDMSLLKARNNNFETPLHSAAKVGNQEVVRDLIQLNPHKVKDALTKRNANGDTALHVAANHNHKDLVYALMRFDPKAAYKGNKLGFSPLYIATVEGYTSTVQAMLQVDATLSCIKFSDGMFLVHVAARMGNSDLVVHFLQQYPDYAELLDPCRRNLFHMAAEQRDEKVFTRVFALATNGSPQISQMVESMINARDYEGNTPLHVAAMKGHSEVMRAIWNELNQDPGTLLRNQKGETAFDLSAIQVRRTNEVIAWKIDNYIKVEGSKFSGKWFNKIMKPPSENEPDRIQTIGLGSVLIITVAFAAAFTVPGGYDTVNGTPVLGRKYMFRAFILANSLAFVQAFGLIFVLGTRTLKSSIDIDELQLANIWFLGAANCMVIAFGLGSYGARTH